MELVQVTNFKNGRYLVSNMKFDKINILKGDLLSSFSVDPLGSSYNEKIYFDTDDFFFADRGVNIYIVTVNGAHKELVVRYDSEQVKRIEFLKDIPNYFKTKVSDNNILKYITQITEAIYRVYPSGLNINIEETLSKASPQIRIFKRRDSYRVVNNTGLKMVMSFDNCEYSMIKGRSKHIQPTLDVVCETTKGNDDFKIFLHSLIRDYPKLIKIESNELTVARNNL